MDLSLNANGLIVLGGFVLKLNGIHQICVFIVSSFPKLLKLA